jgi:hypothetical protein
MSLATSTPTAIFSFLKKFKNIKIHAISQQKYETKKQQESCKTNFFFYLLMEEYK